MELQYFSDCNNGINITPENSSLERISFQYIILENGHKQRIDATGKEVLITLLSGMVTVYIGNTQYSLGPRKDVFSQASYSLYIGDSLGMDIIAQNNAECVVSSAMRQQTNPTRLIAPQHLSMRTVGQGTYARQVHDILKEEDTGAMLLAGETFNEPGKWSSFPPHKHDQDNYPVETQLEELYFFKVNPADKFGIIRLYGTHDGVLHEKTITVKNNSVTVMPFGYHPVCALPDTQLYYYWVLAGKIRKLRYTVDPLFLQ